LRLVLLLPKDPDQSARKIQSYFKEKYGVKIGVLIIDSHGRAWREGIVGTTIGTAGVPTLVDMRGKKDLFGYALKVTEIAAADELAAAASLMMGHRMNMHRLYTYAVSLIRLSNPNYRMSFGPNPRTYFVR
jgi:F420-0:gamma-glutamyl ligase